MLRCAIAGILVYAYGHPGLESLRPSTIDAAFQGVHREVNAVVTGAYRTVARIDNERIASAARAFIGHFEAEIRKD